MLADTNLKEQGQPRARLSSTERRAAIVEAAMCLFAKNGFKGTTTREIAAAVGVSEPVLYQHFAAKRDLYTAIVDQMVADVAAEFEATIQNLNEAASPREFLTALGQAISDWYVKRSGHIRLLFFSALEGHELAAIWHEKATSQFIEVVERGIARWQQQELMRNVNPAVAARAFIGMVAHYELSSTVFHRPLPGIGRQQVLDEFVSLLLEGLNRAPMQEEPR